MTIRSTLATSCIVVLGLAAAPHSAFAGEPITVYTDHSRVLSVSRPPATIIVGNPSIADVTIQGNQVLLHARSFGETNIIVLDEQGSQLADYEVTVQLGGKNNVAVFKAGYRYSYICAPDCESTLHVGDDKEYFLKWIVPEQQAKIKIAMGQKSGENASQDVQDTSSPQQ